MAIIFIAFNHGFTYAFTNILKSHNVMIIYFYLSYSHVRLKYCFVFAKYCGTLLYIDVCLMPFIFSSE